VNRLGLKSKSDQIVINKCDLTCIIYFIHCNPGIENIILNIEENEFNFNIENIILDGVIH
jgi:hypothetical protein